MTKTIIISLILLFLVFSSAEACTTLLVTKGATSYEKK